MGYKEVGMEEIRQGSCKVLIVDDDDLLRETALIMLEALGYEAIAAADGFRAIELYQQQRDCVVLLDVSMSGMDGGMCLHELKRIDPAARIILSSGYLAEDEAVRGVEQYEQVSFLQKPYGPEDLEQALRQLAD